MKVFLDTNVLVSSFTSNGLSRMLVDILVAGHDIVVSPQVVEEFKRIVLAKFSITEIELDDFVRSLLAIAYLSVPPYSVKFPVRDPDDVDILSAALKSGADYLVTGDKDLLSVDAGGAIAIVKPRVLFDLLNDKGV